MGNNSLIPLATTFIVWEKFEALKRFVLGPWSRRVEENINYFEEIDNKKEAWFGSYMHSNEFDQKHIEKCYLY